jgi:Rab-GTPase-TBC domain
VNHRITLDVFVHRWLSTLFSYDLPISFALNAWDLILSCGHLFCPALALAILDHAREDLVGRDANAIVQYFNHLPPSLFDKDQPLLDDAFTHWSHIRKR